jgi:3-oxoacyl-[acyl-carrier-protein] synthase-3
VLFGDGAGCVVLQASDEPGILASHIHADGQYEELLHVPCGISVGYDKTQAGRAFIEMNGNAVFKRAVATFDSMSRETVADLDGELGDIDWFVPHQANMRIIKAAAKKLGMPMERVIATVDEHANTSSASIPLALDTAVRDGRIKRGDMLLFAAFGGGFTWGSAMIKY